VANNKNPNQKQPGEKEPGKFHYNPGNMSAALAKIKSEQQSSADRIHRRHEQQDKKAVDKCR
jgi:hypothetical protein